MYHNILCKHVIIVCIYVCIQIVVVCVCMYIYMYMQVTLPIPVYMYVGSKYHLPIISSLCILLHTGSYMLMHMWKQREKKIGSKSANAVKKGESKDTKQE